MRRPAAFLPILLAGLAALCGYLLSQPSFAGRAGITLFYRQYRFLKTGWQGGLLILIIYFLKMEPKFSNFKEKILNFLKENKSISTISSILNKPTKLIYNAIQRIKIKKNNILTIKKVNNSRILKISPRTTRAINRDLTKSPKKENKRLLIENNFSLSKRTLQRFLRKENYFVNTTFKKPYLNKKNTTT